MKRLNIIVLPILGMIFGLLIAEVASRVIYTEPWYQLLIDEQFKYVQGDYIRHNSLGLRDKEYPVQKSPNSKRVMILGDSFTYGYGITDDDVIFPEILEKQLNSDYAEQGILIEIINGGIPGSLTDDWVDLLLRQEDLSQLDVILIVFFLRDGTQTSSMGSFFGPIRDEIEKRNQERWLYQYSYFYKLYQDAVDRSYLSAKYSEALNEAYLGEPWQTQEWDISKRNLLKIKSMAEEIDAKVGLVVFPVLVELNDNYPFRDICDVLVSFGTENGIPTHNLLVDFLGRNGPDLWVSAYDQHPNAAAHQIAADSILPFLAQLLEDSTK